MYFQIRQLILWRRFQPGRRVLDFELGRVNVISGASKTGKSAVIPIIDYCLGSDRCAIPVGVIRETCEWFGILVETAEGQKLIARREPGNQIQTGDMFVLEGDRIEIPESIPGRNANVDAVKAILDRIAGLSSLGFEPESNGGFKARPAFRDLVSFMFQPQNVIANPDVLFFKANTAEHREKLRTIFPYVLNAVTADDIAARWEIDRLQKLLRRKEAELNAVLATVNVWKAEASAWLRQAVDLGLLRLDTFPEEWPDIIGVLRSVAEASSRSARPSISSVDTTLRRLEELRRRETEIAEEVSQCRQRLNEVHRLIQSSADYGAAIRVQRDRLSIARWMQEQIERRVTSKGSLVALTQDQQQDLRSLVQALESVEMQITSHPGISDRLEREQLRLRTRLESELGKLSEVRQEIAVLERDSEKAREAAYALDRVERFLGRLQQALTLYDRADLGADLQQEISDLQIKIDRLRRSVPAHDIGRRIENAKRSVETAASSIVPELDAEWPDAALRLLIDDLTIKVVRGSRDDYLWEVGSGANWLAYHVAITLGLQRYFLETPHHPVPALLVFDQPSQVYFPRSAVGQQEMEPLWRDEDVIAVRKVFSAIASEVRRAGGRMQVIVLDHADASIWGEIPEVVLAEEWRGGSAKLVPPEWISDGESRLTV